ncbi:MAG: DUF2142 domain-containing protein [Methanobacteriaceae archaeon]|jgi:uncharacterized membrane protein|nr:DUF2142 domain-containing protein [Methanobacteriaceae archaeon]
MNYKNNLNIIFNDILDLKYFIIAYILILVFFSFSFYNLENYLNPGFEIVIFLILGLIGAISILYYNKNRKSLHKVVFLIIMVFGILCLFTSPINDISDEQEHFTHSEIVSQGEILTEYVQIPGTNVSGYKTIHSIVLLAENAGMNVFNSDVDDKKINHTVDYQNSAFSQNPFYGYLPQAIGIFIAKLFDLNTIWMLWLARFFNLLLYGGICAIAIKKAPIFKFPLFVAMCLPIAIYQGASMSIDSTINAFSFLSIAYFLNMYKSPDDSINWKTLTIFLVSCLLVGLIKIPYLLLGFLLYLIPKEKFKTFNQYIVSRIGVFGLFLIGILWNFGYATHQLKNSWRGEYFTENNVSTKGQIEYIINNPSESIPRFLQIGNTIPNTFNRLFYFSNTALREYSSNLLGALYALFFGVFSLIYPSSIKIKLSNRVKLFLIASGIYISTFIIQYLSWAPIGNDNLMNGVFGRYFISLLVFIPLIFGFNYKKIDILYKNKENLNLAIITLIIGFIAGMIILTISVKY